MKNIVICLFLFSFTACVSSEKSTSVVENNLEQPTLANEADSVSVSDESEDRTVAQSNSEETPVMWERLKREEYREWNKKQKKYIYKEKIVEAQDVFDKRLPEAKKWTKWVNGFIRNEASYLLGQNSADDVDGFCPKYRKLNDEQRVKFWTQLVAALTYKESNWTPTVRYPEKGLGIDPVTKKYVYSEGLMQLSYQDVKNYKEHFDCKFNYNVDKAYKTNDPRRTILSPYSNLRCGVLILNHLVKNNRKIVLEKPYWSVLGANHKNSKVSWIKRRTQSLSFCK